MAIDESEFAALKSRVVKLEEIVESVSQFEQGSRFSERIYNALRRWMPEFTGEADRQIAKIWSEVDSLKSRR